MRSARYFVRPDLLTQRSRIFLFFCADLLFGYLFGALVCPVFGRALVLSLSARKSVLEPLAMSLIEGPGIVLLIYLGGFSLIGVARVAPICFFSAAADAILCSCILLKSGINGIVVILVSVLPCAALKAVIFSLSATDAVSFSVTLRHKSDKRFSDDVRAYLLNGVFYALLSGSVVLWNCVLSPMIGEYIL